LRKEQDSMPGFMSRKIPIFKFQIPNNSEFPNTNDPNQIVTDFNIWDLRFIWSLDIGIW
jgi:hypothetical protein